jgi:hypothetical protein
MRVHDANGPKFELRSSAVKADASSALTEYDQIPDVVIWRAADRSATTLLIARISCNQTYQARFSTFPAHMFIVCVNCCVCTAAKTMISKTRLVSSHPHRQVALSCTSV